MKKPWIAAATSLAVVLAMTGTATAETIIAPGAVALRPSPTPRPIRRIATPDPIRFEPDDAFNSTGGPSSVAAGDLTGDGRADLLVSNYTSGTCGCPLDLYVQNTDGSLADPVSLDTTSTFYGERGAAIGDLDGDDDLDVAVAVSDGVDWFEQSGGTLLPAVHVASPAANGDEVAIADLDGDGLGDIVEAGTELDVFINTGTGFTLGTLAQISLKEMEVGDVTGDDAPDIVIAHQGSVDVYANENDGTGAFAAPDAYATSSWVGAIALGDGNDDGRTDVMVGVGGNSDSKMNYFRQTTAGTLAARVVYESKDIPDSADVADFNGDGRDDLVIGHGTWNTFGVYLQLSDGTFAREQLYPTGYHNYEPKGIATGDVNGDGKADVVFGDWSGQVHVWRQARGLTIAAAHKVRFGTDIAWTAKLAKPNSTANKTLSIYEVIDKVPHLITTGDVDAKGVLTGVYPNAKHNVQLRVEWDGDARSAATSDTVRTLVAVITTGTLKGAYARSGTVHLYHRGDVPIFVGKVTPNHSGSKLNFRLQRKNAGGWATVSRASVKIRADGTIAVSIGGLRVGADYRIRCEFDADKDHAGDVAPWSYLRVT
jgi:hypothetical protein